MRFIEKTDWKHMQAMAVSIPTALNKNEKHMLLTLDFAADSLVVAEWFPVIYCMIGWQLTSDESWNTSRIRTGRSLFTLQHWFLLAGKVTGNHWWKRYVTVYAITNYYLELMPLFPNSDCGVQKTLELDRFLAKVWATRHIKSIPQKHVQAFTFRTVQRNLRCWFQATTDTANKDK